MDCTQRVTTAGRHGELVAPSRRDGRSANAESGQDEYVELAHLIMDGGWAPGDIVRTANGGTWQFRELPYTADISKPEAPSTIPMRTARRPSSISRLRRGPVTWTR
jgi:hypothetical protein